MCVCVKASCVRTRAHILIKRAFYFNLVFKAIVSTTSINSLIDRITHSKNLLKKIILCSQIPCTHALALGTQAANLLHSKAYYVGLYLILFSVFFYIVCNF